MASTLSTIFNFFAKPPGDLIYHLIVSLALIFTIVMVLIKQGNLPKSSKARSLLIGCSILLLLQIALFGLRFLNTEIGFERVHLYHLFERLASTLTILWLVWAFFDIDQHDVPTNLLLVLSFTLIILAVVSIFAQPLLTQLQIFNPLSMDLIWQLIAIVMIIIGLMLALFIRPPLVKVLILILAILAVGHILQIVLINDMRWRMGAVRFAQIVSLPWLTVFINYFPSGENQVQRFNKKPEKKPERKIIKIQHKKTNKSILSSKLLLVKSTLVKWMTSLKNYFSKKAKPESPPIIESAKGYIEMTADTKPTLVDLLLKINLARTPEEKFQTVVQALSLSVVADICFLVTIPDEGDKLHVVSGYDLIRETTYKADTLVREDLPMVMRAWENHQHLELLNDTPDAPDAQTLALLLNYHTIGNLLAYPLGLPEKPLAGGVIFLSPYTGKRWGSATIQLMDQITDTLGAVLFSPVTQQNTTQGLNQAQLKINALAETSEKLRKTLSEKEAQIREKETIIKGLKAKYQIDKMENMTRFEQMKQKIAYLNSQVASQSLAPSELEQLQNENRQLSSEREQLQLELVRAKRMLNELQTETGQTGPIRLSLKNQIISLDSIAANVHLRVASQLQEHNIDLEIHNPDGRLMIKTDPELLQTALHELLSNAIMASETGGSIKLEQKLSLEMGMLTIQVTDFGEGLTPAEQSALFSAQHDSIPGIGDVQSVRNAIRAIRVLNGKIWLKSKKVSFTTFRFQIPVRIID